MVLEKNWFRNIKPSKENSFHLHESGGVKKNFKNKESFELKFMLYWSFSALTGRRISKISSISHDIRDSIKSNQQNFFKYEFKNRNV